MTIERRAARFRLSPELLKKALSLPEDAQVYGVDWNFSEDAIAVYVHDANLHPVPEGCSVPEVQLILTTTTDDQGRVTKTEGRWS